MDFLRSTDDLRAAEQAAEVGDDVDLWINSDGRLGMVAKARGVHVCWECFEPLSQHDPDPNSKAVEVFPDGATTGVYLHARCARARVAPKIYRFAQGMRVRQGIAGIVRKTGENGDAQLADPTKLAALGAAIRAQKSTKP